MAIADGESVNATNSNRAWLDAELDDQALGKIGFENADVVSGYFIENIQRYINNVAQTIGLDYTGNYTAEADATGRDYDSTSTVIANGDTFKEALTKLADKFAGLSADGGHTHTGADDDGPQLPAAAIANFRAGTLQLTNGSDAFTVVFSTDLPSANYVADVTIFNGIDAFPSFLTVNGIQKATTGFTGKLNAPVDSTNYFLNYIAVEPV